MWRVEPGALVRRRATPNIVSLTLALSLPSSERLVVSEQCQPKLSRHRRFGWSDPSQIENLSLGSKTNYKHHKHPHYLSTTYVVTYG